MIKRDLYLQKVVDYMWDGHIKVITGIRCTGKSTLLFNIFYDYLLKNGVAQGNIITLSLDKRKHAKYRNPLALSDFVESTISASRKKYYLFIS